MESISVLSATAVPWANGKGQTRVLAQGGMACAWRWRVSLADLPDSAAFSTLPGVERWVALTRGPWLGLGFEGEEVRQLTLGDTTHFSGATPPYGRVTPGPNQVLNLMLRGVPGAMAPATEPMHFKDSDRVRAMYCEEPVWLRLGNDPAFEVPPQTLVLDTGSCGRTWDCRGTDPRPSAWWLRVGPFSD